MLASLRRLTGHSAIYALSNVLARSASYALIPVYAHLLSPTEYGLFGVITAVANAASVVLMFGLYAAAVNTVIALCVLAGLNFALARRVHLVRHQYGRWLKAIGAAVVVGTIGQFARLDSVWAESVARLALAGLWVLALLALGFFDRCEREALVRRLWVRA